MAEEASAGGAWTGVAGGALQMAGGIAGAIASARQAAKNRSFQKHMFRHRYQYQVEDLRKAGLNPMLAYMQSPGSAPAGAMAKIGNPAEGVVASASQARLLRKQNELLQKDIDKRWHENMTLDAQRGLLDEQMSKTKSEHELVRAQLPSAKALADFDRSFSGRQLIKANRAAQLTTGWLPLFGKSGGKK